MSKFNVGDEVKVIGGLCTKFFGSIYTVNAVHEDDMYTLDCIPDIKWGGTVLELIQKSSLTFKDALKAALEGYKIRVIDNDYYIYWSDQNKKFMIVNKEHQQDTFHFTDFFTNNNNWEIYTMPKYSVGQFVYRKYGGIAKIKSVISQNGIYLYNLQLSKTQTTDMFEKEDDLELVEEFN